MKQWTDMATDSVVNQLHSVAALSLGATALAIPLRADVCAGLETDRNTFKVRLTDCR